MLTLHLWKEWREQRLMIAAFTAALVVCGALTVALAPRQAVPRDLGSWFAIGGLALAFVGLVGDLVPGETRRGQFDLLRRTPGALRRAFFAKSILLIAGLVGCAALGLGIGELTWHLSDGSDATTDSHAVLLWVFAATICCTPLAFACSCWFGRGSSALPATAMVFGLVAGVPAAVISIYALPVTQREVLTTIGWCVLAGVTAAAASWFGLRFGSRWQSARRGLLASAVAVCPVWGMTGATLWDLHHFDPNDRDARIYSAMLGARRDALFVTVFRDWSENDRPYTTLRVDLDTGDWVQTGGTASHFVGVGMLTGSEFLGGLLAPQDYLLRLDGHRRGDGPNDSISLLDGADGSVLRRFQTTERAGSLFELVDLDGFTDVTRSSTPLRLRDGTRAWLDQGEVVFESPSGERTTTAWPERSKPSFAVGYGLMWNNGESSSSWRIFDLARRRTFAQPAGLDWSRILVRSGDWVLQGSPDDEDGSDDRLRRWNPETGVSTDLLACRIDSQPLLAGDEDLIVLESGEGGRVLRWNVEQDTVTELALSDDHGCSKLQSPHWHLLSLPCLTPDGRRILARTRTDGSLGFARLDGNRLTSTAATQEEIELQAILSDDEVLVLVDSRRLERWTFGSEARRPIFEVGR